MMVQSIFMRTFKELNNMPLARHKDLAVMSIMRRQKLRNYFSAICKKRKLITSGKGIVFEQVKCLPTAGNWSNTTQA